MICQWYRRVVRAPRASETHGVREQHHCSQRRPVDVKSLRCREESSFGGRESCPRGMSSGEEIETALESEVLPLLWEVRDNLLGWSEELGQAKSFGHRHDRRRTPVALPGPARPPELHAGVESERGPEPGRQAGYIGALPPGPAPAEGDWFTRLLERWEEVQQRIEKLQAGDAADGGESRPLLQRKDAPAEKPNHRRRKRYNRSETSFPGGRTYVSFIGGHSPGRGRPVVTGRVG